ncbi:MAG: hypothetical protein WBL06_05180 [Pseudolysinimonas sp.]|uniref:hypothetical protein n=1 Tax=Pseudolysinimonas sp. TaxID=2680009 RepID=UPI003C748B1C
MTEQDTTGRADALDADSNASGDQAGNSAQTEDVVDSGQSEDIENSLTGQGVSDDELSTAQISTAALEGEAPCPDAASVLEEPNICMWGLRSGRLSSLPPGCGWDDACPNAKISRSSTTMLPSATSRPEWTTESPE